MMAGSLATHRGEKLMAGLALVIPSNVEPFIVALNGHNVKFTQNPHAKKSHYSHMIRWMSSGEGQYRLAGILSQAFKALAAFALLAKIDTHGATAKWLADGFGRFSGLTVFGYGVGTADTLAKEFYDTRSAAEQAEWTALSSSEKAAKWVKKITDAVVPVFYVALEFAPALAFGKFSAGNLGGLFTFAGDLSDGLIENNQREHLVAAFGAGWAGDEIGVGGLVHAKTNATPAQINPVVNAAGNNLTAVQNAAVASLREANTLQLIKLAKIVSAVFAGVLLVATLLSTIPVTAAGATLISVGAKTALALKLGTAVMSFVSPLLATTAYLYKESMQFHVKIVA